MAACICASAKHGKIMKKQQHQASSKTAIIAYSMAGSGNNGSGINSRGAYQSRRLAAAAAASGMAGISGGGVA